MNPYKVTISDSDHPNIANVYYMNALTQQDLEDFLISQYSGSPNISYIITAI